MRVAIVDVLGSPYDGSTLSKRGLGGSESAVISIARELVELDVDVDVYCDCTSMDAEPGIYDNVTYRSRDGLEFQSDAYDVLISSRSIKGIDALTANYKVLWMHDTFCDGDNLVESMVVNGQIDEIWTLSDWHTTYISQCNHGIRRMAEVLKRKIWVTRNGVNLYREAEIHHKNRNQFVFNAAVNKGMVTLLEDVWPKLHAKAPETELIIIGGAYPLKNGDVQNVQLDELHKKHHGKNGVSFTGIISQDLVASILSASAFMIYPQSFPETFGISTVESLAYGTPVITGRFGAMEETAIEEACYLMDYPVDSNVLYTFNKEAHVDHFVTMAYNAWSDYYLWQQKANSALKVREVCTWDTVALQWKQHLFHKLGLYLPVSEYRRVTQINHRVHKIFNKRWSNPEEWGYYPEKEKMIHVIVPFYNASQYLKKCFESIETQNYDNFHVWAIDDASTDNGIKLVPDSSKFTAIVNDENKGALANQIMAIDELIDGGYNDIIVLIDGDDALSNDPNIFKRINQLYHEGAEFTYGSCWSLADNIPLIAQEYPAKVIANKTFKEHKFPWNMPYTHLRTFKYSLYLDIDTNDLCDSDGNVFKAGGDSALFYALIERAKPSGIKCVRDITYIYNDLNPINDYKVNSQEQVKTSSQVLSKPRKVLTEAEKKQNLVDCIMMHRLVTRPKKILIAIPTANNIYPDTFKSIYDLEIPDGYEVEFQYFFGYCVDQVRNLIADWTVKHYDYLFAVDYDMSFPPDTLKKLLAHDVDLVSGLYIQRKPGEHILELYRTAENGAQYNIPIQTLNKNTLESIDGCGFGCVLVKKQVFEAIGYPHFTYHHALSMSDTISEDVDFCNKAREKGFKLYADTSVTCRHHGQTTFEVNNG